MEAMLKTHLQKKRNKNLPLHQVELNLSLKEKEFRQIKHQVYLKMKMAKGSHPTIPKKKTLRNQLLLLLLKHSPLQPRRTNQKLTNKKKKEKFLNRFLLKTNNPTIITITTKIITTIITLTGKNQKTIHQMIMVTILMALL